MVNYLVQVLGLSCGHTVMLLPLGPSMEKVDSMMAPPVTLVPMLLQAVWTMRIFTIEL